MMIRCGPGRFGFQSSHLLFWLVPYSITVFWGSKCKTTLRHCCYSGCYPTSWEIRSSSSAKSIGWQCCKTEGARIWSLNSWDGVWHQKLQGLETQHSRPRHPTLEFERWMDDEALCSCQKQLWNSFLTWRPRLRPKKDWLNNIIIMYFIMNFVDGIIRLTDSTKLKWILWCPLFRWAGRPGLKNLGVGEQHMALFLTCWVTWEKTWKTGCIEESFPNRFLSFDIILGFYLLWNLPMI